MDNMYPSWKLWAVESFYAVGFYLVGTIFFDKEIDNIVAKM